MQQGGGNRGRNEGPGSHMPVIKSEPRAEVGGKGNAALLESGPWWGSSCSCQDAQAETDERDCESKDIAGAARCPANGLAC